MSRKRGKHKKGAVEAVPAEILAEGSGPVDVAAHVVTTVDDVVTTDDVATSDDVITPDDVVATEPASAPEPAPKTRKKKPKREAKAAAASGPAEDDGDLIADVPVRTPDPNELNNAELAALIEAQAAVEARAADAAAPQGQTDGDGDGDDGDDRRDDDAEALQADAGGGDDGDPLDGDVGDHGGGDDGDGGDEDDDGEVEAEDSARFPTSAGSMDSLQLKHLVESLVFASDKPMTVQRLRQLTRVGDIKRLQLALTELEVDYRERGVVLQQVSGGYQFRTRTQFSAWVQQLIAGRPVRLSRAQLETLAIIAYRQPITRPEIDDIRGVDSTATVKLLLDRMLIRSLGKREEVGRPTLYGTTKDFLDFFSLGDLRELPTLREYSELTAESRKVMSDRLGIAHDDEPVPSRPRGGHDPDDGGSSGGGSSGGGGGGGGSSGSGGSSGGGGGGSSGNGGGGGGSSGPASDDGFDPGVDPTADSDGSELDAPPAPETPTHVDAMSSYFAAAEALDRSDASELGEPDEAVEPDEVDSSSDLDIDVDADGDGISADLLAGDLDDHDSAESPSAGESADDGQVSGEGWPLGSQPVAVVAPIDVRPVERPSMDEINATSLDADGGTAAPAPHVGPAAPVAE